MNTFQKFLVLAFLALSKACVSCYRQNDYLLNSSFFEGTDILETSNELSEAFIAEIEEFNRKVLEKLADRMVVVFEKNGFDLNNKDNVDKLYNFLQKAGVEAPEEEVETVPVKKNFREHLKGFGGKLFNGLKKAANGIGKEAIVHAVKGLIPLGIKQAMPELEKMFKNALNHLPLKVRLAVAPLFFKLWQGLFKKAKIEPPKDFNFKSVVYDGLSEEEKKIANKYLGIVGEELDNL